MIWRDKIGRTKERNWFHMKKTREINECKSEPKTVSCERRNPSIRALRSEQGIGTLGKMKVAVRR